MTTGPKTHDPTDALAVAVRETLISPNVLNANREPANVVDALASIARALWAIAAALEKVSGPKDEEEERQSSPG